MMLNMSGFMSIGADRKTRAAYCRGGEEAVTAFCLHIGVN